MFRSLRLYKEKPEPGKVVQNTFNTREIDICLVFASHIYVIEIKNWSGDITIETTPNSHKNKIPHSHCWRQVKRGYH